MNPEKPINTGIVRLIEVPAVGLEPRTHTPSRTTDFESVSSANSDTPA